MGVEGSNGGPFQISIVTLHLAGLLQSYRVVKRLTLRKDGTFNINALSLKWNQYNVLSYYKLLSDVVHANGTPGCRQGQTLVRLTRQTNSPLSCGDMFLPLKFIKRPLDV